MWSFLEPEKYANTQALLIFFKLLCIDNRIKIKSRNDPENCLTIKKNERAFYFYFLLFYFILVSDRAWGRCLYGGLSWEAPQGAM